MFNYYNKDFNRAGFLISNNLAAPVDRFHEISGFDVRLSFAGGEDRDFCERWSNQGNSMIYDPKIQVYHAHHLSLYTFLRQQYTYGRGSYLFHKLRAVRNHNSIHFSPLFFYLKLLCYPLSKTRGLEKIRFFILIFLSQLAIGTGFIFSLIMTNIKPRWNSE